MVKNKLKITMENWLETKNVRELKDICRENNLYVTGIKKDIIQRLIQHFCGKTILTNDDPKDNDEQNTDDDET